MKKITKIVSVIMIIMMLAGSLTTVLGATTYNPDQWKNQTGDKIQTGDIQNFSASIINVVSIVGSAAAIITLIILGIKYMMGSAEEKAEYKKTMIPYLVGAILVFGATQIAGAVLNFAK